MTTLDQFVTEYRQHARMARDMVTRRNRRYLTNGCATSGETMWSERSFEAYERHSARQADIARTLRDMGRDEIAEALNAESAAMNAVTWRRIKLAAGLPGEIEPRLTRALVKLVSR
jgi:hypothetical protein